MLLPCRNTNSHSQDLKDAVKQVTSTRYTLVTSTRYTLVTSTRYTLLLLLLACLIPPRARPAIFRVRDADSSAEKQLALAYAYAYAHAHVDAQSITLLPLFHYSVVFACYCISTATRWTIVSDVATALACGPVTCALVIIIQVHR